MPSKKKKIVYLFGTGATQAEASLIDDRIRLLMFDVKDGILKRMTNKNIEGFGEVKNELAGDNVDVEQLISLYDSSENKRNEFSSSWSISAAFKTTEIFSHYPVLVGTENYKKFAL